VSEVLLVKCKLPSGVIYEAEGEDAKLILERIAKRLAPIILGYVIKGLLERVLRERLGY
jgi:hypothetical protein